MRTDLKSVAEALEFLEGATKSDKMRGRLEETSTHQEVIDLARAEGKDLTRETLAQAMKILVDRSLEAEGIPSWVRARVHAPVHD